MKFLKFPFLVQEHILKTMSFEEIFLLSFCSQKLPLIISHVLWKIEAIRFFVKDNLVGVGVRDIRKTKILLGSFRFSFALRGKKCCWKNGLQYRFLKGTKIRYPAFIFLKIDKKTAIQFLYWHIHKLFRTAVEDELEVDDIYHTSNFPDRTPFKTLKWIPSFPNAQNFKAVTFRKNVSAEMLNDCYKKYPNLKSTYFDAVVEDGTVESSLNLETESIHSLCRNFGASFISRFKGRCAVLSNVVFGDSTVVRFIRKWLNGSYDKLEILDVSLAGPLLDSEEIFKKFDFKKYEKRETMDDNHLDFILITHYPCDLHERNFWFLEHPKNGTVASVEIHPECFHFYVWNRNKGIFPKIGSEDIEMKLSYRKFYKGSWFPGDSSFRNFLGV